MTGKWRCRISGRRWQSFSDIDIATIDDTYQKLSVTNAADKASATTFVEGTLLWSVEPFNQVMELRAQLAAGQTPQPPPPTDSEWNNMERLLTTAYKQ